jgi:hypothetical protein
LWLHLCGLLRESPMAVGCGDHIVSFTGRRAVYLGRAHVEHVGAKFLIFALKPKQREVCSGSKATEMGFPGDVRFSPVSDRLADIAGGPVRAKGGLMRCSKWSPFHHLLGYRRPHQ